MSIVLTDSKLTFILADRGNFKKRHVLTFAPGVDRADIIAFAEAYMPILKAEATAAGIVSYNITRNLAFIDADPEPGSSVYDTCSVLMQTAIPTIGDVQIPGFNPALVEPAGSYAGIAVQAAYLPALESALLVFSDVEGNQFTNLQRAFLQRAGQYI